jgi:hypothetical protein
VIVEYILSEKGKFYKAAVRPAILYGTECWAVKKQRVHKMSVAEMRMLRWISGNTRIYMFQMRKFP